MRVAYHTITWGDKFRQALDDIAAVGYKGFETFGLQEWFERVDDFKALISGKGLELASVYCGGDFITPGRVDMEVEGIARTARFLQAMGCKELVLGGGRKKEGGNTEEDYRMLADTVNRIGKICNDLGLCACYHPHLGTMVENREQLAKLCELTDSELVFLAPDTAPLTGGGADPVEVFQNYIGRIKYVHFKDYKGGRFCELGEGVVNFPAVMEILNSVNYDGWIVVDLNSTTRTPKESAIISKRYLEEKLWLKV